MVNKLNITLPIAHQNNADYGNYYQGTACKLHISKFFNQDACEGLSISADSGTDPNILNVFALTDGFLSYKNNLLVLRLPIELNNNSNYNSGKLFLKTIPKGPQLRYVIYDGLTDLNTIKQKVRDILQSTGHPVRDITKTLINNDVKTLSDYLTDSTKINNVIDKFISGNQELFVKAGDVIGNFSNNAITIKFLDSCGSIIPNQGSATSVFGRPLNPSYFIYLFLSTTNTASVNLLTSISNSTNIQNTHPVNHLLLPANITDHSYDYVGLDMNLDHPPKPLQITIPSTVPSIDSKFLRIGTLSDFHESRNSPNPNTCAPIRWRIYGNGPYDTDYNNLGKIIAEVKLGKNNLLPDQFDVNFSPQIDHSNTVTEYWNRYGHMINAVAKTFEIPCELILAIAAKESGGGSWYEKSNFVQSDEMNVIRLEPLKGTSSSIPNTSTSDRSYLSNYQSMVPSGDGGGCDAITPITWDDGVNIDPFTVKYSPPPPTSVRIPNPGNLTWLQLAQLAKKYPNNVKISPGIMQTLISSAMTALRWIKDVYGIDYLANLKVTVDGINLSVDDPPTDLQDLLIDWFCVSVDNSGNNTTDKISTDIKLTKNKRAFHSIVAGAAHIKMNYNFSVNNTLRITDFDPLTVASGYNDSASLTQCATTNNDDKIKMLKVFAMIFYDYTYPKKFPKLYNAAIDLFNSNANPIPTVRLVG